MTRLETIPDPADNGGFIPVNRIHHYRPRAPLSMALSLEIAGESYLTKRTAPYLLLSTR